MPTTASAFGTGSANVSEEMVASWQAAVLDYVKQAAGEIDRVLWLGEPRPEVGTADRLGVALTTLPLSLDMVQGCTERFGLAVVTPAIVDLEARARLALVARLRDVQARRLLIVVPEAHAFNGESRALGLRHHLLTGAAAAAPKFSVYGFDLYDYRRTPDWLNSRYWANPERWNESRW